MASTLIRIKARFHTNALKLSIAVLVSLNFGHCRADGQSYNISEIVPLTGTETSAAWAINNHGRVVGESERRPVYWNGESIDLSTWNSELRVYWGDINDKGEIVFEGDDIWYAKIIGYPQEPPTRITFTSFASSNSRGATGINNLGEVAISYWGDPPPNVPVPVARAEKWKLGSGFRNLLPSFTSSRLDAYAAAINDRGSVVGDYGPYYSEQDFRRVFLRTNVGTSTYPPPVPGHDFGVTAINNLNQFVGVYDGGSFVRKNGSYWKLNPLPGDDDSYASSINDTGDIVGSSYRGWFAGERACIWKQGAASDLQSAAVNSEGWILSEAVGINNAGQIVGNGTLNGRRRGFVLTPEIFTKVVDPNPNLINISGGLKKDVSLAVEDKNLRTGAVADGISKLLLIARCRSVTRFRISGRLSDDLSQGTLEPYMGVGGANLEVEVQPQRAADGEYYAIAVYTPPSICPTDPLDRIVRIQVADTNASGLAVSSLTLKLEQAPVILVHGLWSGPTVWLTGGFYDYLRDQDFKVFLAGYNSASTFNPSIASNSAITSVGDHVKLALKALRISGIAASQCDVVGHSMGGLMTRGYIQQQVTMNRWKRPDNYMNGYIRKLITIGTPHLGSSLAALLYGYRDAPIAGVPTKVSSVFERFGMPIAGGAVESLAPNSPALQAMKACEVPCHAITASWEPGASSSAAILSKLTDWVTGGTVPNLATAFGGQENDTIVSLKSQQGKLDPSGSGVSKFPGVVHAAVPRAEGDPTETSADEIMEHVNQLLIEPLPSAYFAPAFPAYTQFALPEPVAFPVSRAIAASSVADELTITITSPASGTVVPHDGTTVLTLAAEVNGTNLPDEVLFVVEGVGMAVAKRTSGYTVTLPVSGSAALGQHLVVAMVLNSSGEKLIAESNINLTAPGPAVGLKISPEEVLLTPELNRQKIEVFADFGSGKWVDVGRLENELQYQIESGEHVYDLAADGMISAAADGSGSVKITYKGQTTTANVSSTGFPNPLLSSAAKFAGTYRTLLGDPAGAPDARGSLVVSLSPTRVFSAVVLLGAQTYRLKGRLLADGSYAAPVAASSLSVAMQLDLNDQNGQIFGTLSGGLAPVAFTADRDYFSLKRPYPLAAGRHNFLLEPPSAPGIPQGLGNGFLIMGRTGRVSLSAILGDGHRITFSTGVSKSLQLPLYVTTHGGAGSLFGKVRFGNEADSDSVGRLNWHKSRTLGSQFFPDGYAVEVDFSSSQYRPPPAGQSVLGLTRGDVTTIELSGGDLAELLRVGLVVQDPRVISSQTGDETSVRISVNPATGVMIGRFSFGFSDLGTEFSGIVLPKRKLCGGIFLGTRATTGAFRINTGT